MGLVVPVLRGPLANVKAKGCRSFNALQKSLFTISALKLLKGGIVPLCDFHDEEDCAKGGSCSVDGDVAPET